MISNNDKMVEILWEDVKDMMGRYGELLGGHGFYLRNLWFDDDKGGKECFRELWCVFSAVGVKSRDITKTIAVGVDLTRDSDASYITRQVDKRIKLKAGEIDNGV